MTAAAAIAAAVLSGCTTVVNGVAQPSGDLQAAGTAPSPDATTSPSSAEPRWVEGTWQGSLPKNEKHDQYAESPQPGVVIAQAGYEGCTIGPAVVGGFLTAGHCDQAPGTPVRLYTDASGKHSIQAGYFEKSENSGDDPDPRTKLFRDSVLLDTGPVADSTRSIAGHYPVAGVLTLDAARSLETGTHICLDGSKSGTTCGTVTEADEGGKMRIDVSTQDGDSGAAVFLVDRQGQAALVGLVKGGDGSSAVVTYLEPALQRIGAKALLDPHAVPFSGKEFNVAVTASN